MHKKTTKLHYPKTNNL